MTEAEITTVRRAQAGDAEALDFLVDRWLPVVLRWSIRMGEVGHAEDVAHEVFEVLLDRLSTLRAPEAFSTWLYGITRRVLARHRRRAWFRKWVPGAVPDIADTGASPCRLTESSEVAQAVHEALNQLTSDHREVLVLSDMEERPDSEVAAMLGVPKGTVKSRLRRARARLRELVPELASEILPFDAARGDR
jgi:RNA polymerase sigma-70 factor, ECF subfamily